MLPDHQQRLARAITSLEGLSVGDAFGERYFTSGANELIAARMLAYPPWHYTDDTQMALSVVSVLRQHGCIQQDALATNFSVHYEEDRGYGDAMNYLVPMIFLEGMWRMLAPRLFSGEGSLGNGAAMRIAPLGGYLADDVGEAAAQAALSAEVTHAHPEGIAGAIAVAVAAAQAAVAGTGAACVFRLSGACSAVRAAGPGRGRFAAGAKPAAGYDGTSGGAAIRQRVQCHGPRYRSVCPLVRGPEPGRLRGSLVADRQQAGGLRYELRHCRRHRVALCRHGRHSSPLATGP